MVRYRKSGIVYFTFSNIIAAEDAASSLVRADDVMYCVVLQNEQAIGGYLNDNGEIRELTPK
jgi:hypothetical protein